LNGDLLFTSQAPHAKPLKAPKVSVVFVVKTDTGVLTPDMMRGNLVKMDWSDTYNAIDEFVAGNGNAKDLPKVLKDHPGAITLAPETP
jgi:hypothetical protein